MMSYTTVMAGKKYNLNRVYFYIKLLIYITTILY